jgi:hypothetical protein
MEQETCIHELFHQIITMFIETLFPVFDNITHATTEEVRAQRH